MVGIKFPSKPKYFQTGSRVSVKWALNRLLLTPETDLTKSQVAFLVLITLIGNGSSGIFVVFPPLRPVFYDQREGYQPECKKYGSTDDPRGLSQIRPGNCIVKKDATQQKRDDSKR